MLKICGIIHVSTVQECAVGSLDFNKTVTAVTQRLTPNINSDWRGFERLSAERAGEWPRADLGQPLVASQQGRTLTQALTTQVRMCGCTWQPVMCLLHQWHSLHPLPYITCPSLIRNPLHIKYEGCSPYYQNNVFQQVLHPIPEPSWLLKVINTCWKGSLNGELVYQFFHWSEGRDECFVGVICRLN